MLKQLEDFLNECHRKDRDPEAYDITLKLSDGVEVHNIVGIDTHGDDVTIRSASNGIVTTIHTTEHDCLRWWRISI